MIFPRICKEVGYASRKPCGSQVYFLSRYLVHETPRGTELLEVIPGNGRGLMRQIQQIQTLAAPEETTWYDKKVCLHNRAHLLKLALDSGFRCTIFTGLDEHLTFILDPDASSFQTVFIYDVIPPRPSLSATINELEEAGMFSELDIRFDHMLRNIGETGADVYPCRASGLGKTLDTDELRSGETVAGCMTGRQLVRECYGNHFQVTDICPLSFAEREPFITRCCRKENEGIGDYHGKFGAVVHWGASPSEIYSALGKMLSLWRAGG